MQGVISLADCFVGKDFAFDVQRGTAITFDKFRDCYIHDLTDEIREAKTMRGPEIVFVGNVDGEGDQTQRFDGIGKLNLSASLARAKT